MCLSVALLTVLVMSLSVNRCQHGMPRAAACRCRHCRSCPDQSVSSQGIVMLKLQAVVSASTIALREIEAEQAEAQEAAINSITILSGCNRTVDMQYTFVVSVLLPCHGCLLQIMSTTVSSRIRVVTSFVRTEKRRTEKTTPFGVNLMRSQVLYRAAQYVICNICVSCQVLQQCTSSTLASFLLAACNATVV